MIREWQNSLRQQKSTSAPKGRSANVILSYKIGIEAHIEAVMPQCEADLKSDILVKAVYHISLETWVIIAVIVLVLIDKQLIFATVIYVYTMLLGFFKLVIKLSCVLGTHTVATHILVNVAYQRSGGRKTTLELIVNPLGEVLAFRKQYG